MRSNYPTNRAILAGGRLSPRPTPKLSLDPPPRHPVSRPSSGTPRPTNFRLKVAKFLRIFHFGTAADTLLCDTGLLSSRTEVGPGPTGCAGLCNLIMLSTCLASQRRRSALSPCPSRGPGGVCLFGGSADGSVNLSRTHTRTHVHVHARTRRSEDIVSVSS